MLEKQMRSGLVAVTLSTVALLAAIAPSHAQVQPLEITYPYCWNKSFFNQNNSCGFTSYAQCERFRMGGEGYCSTNPLYRGPPPGAVGRKKKKSAAR